MLHLKPALLDGAPMVIRDPVNGRPIPAHGVSVSATPYWRTLRRHGDVIDTTEAEIRAAEQPKASAAKAKE